MFALTSWVVSLIHSFGCINKGSALWGSRTYALGGDKIEAGDEEGGAVPRGRAAGAAVVRSDRGAAARARRVAAAVAAWARAVARPIAIPAIVNKVLPLANPSLNPGVLDPQH
jgi:hypothetical protein